jgi:hypothetical protein
MVVKRGLTASAVVLTGGLGLAPIAARRCKVRRLETIDVPDNGSIVFSATRLVEGRRYQIGVAGVVGNAAPVTGMDAEYQFDAGDPPRLLGACQGNGVDVGLGIDDEINDTEEVPNWGPYNPGHQYEISYVGQGRQISLRFHDCGYGDNEGALRVRIYGCR